MLVFVGQALTGIGNPMAVSVPTKVSQNWFRESQRTFATICLAMSLPLGIVLGQGSENCQNVLYLYPLHSSQWLNILQKRDKNWLKM